MALRDLLPENPPEHPRAARESPFRFPSFPARRHLGRHRLSAPDRQKTHPHLQISFHSGYRHSARGTARPDPSPVAAPAPGHPFFRPAPPPPPAFPRIQPVTNPRRTLGAASHAGSSYRSGPPHPDTHPTHQAPA